MKLCAKTACPAVPGLDSSLLRRPMSQMASTEAPQQTTLVPPPLLMPPPPLPLLELGVAGTAVLPPGMLGACTNGTLSAALQRWGEQLTRRWAASAAGGQGEGRCSRPTQGARHATGSATQQHAGRRWPGMHAWFRLYDRASLRPGPFACVCSRRSAAAYSGCHPLRSNPPCGWWTGGECAGQRAAALAHCQPGSSAAGSAGAGAAAGSPGCCSASQPQALCPALGSTVAGGARAAAAAACWQAHLPASICWARDSGSSICCADSPAAAASPTTAAAASQA